MTTYIFDFMHYIVIIAYTVSSLTLTDIIAFSKLWLEEY